MNPQRQEGNREKASRKPQWKNYDFTMFWSRITTSHGIAVKWYLRVYWLLPFSIVDSFKKHRRFFCLESTILLESIVNTWVSPSTSFPKGFISSFLRTLFPSSTETADSLAEVILNQQTPANKTSLFLLTQRSYPTCWTLVIGWAVQRYVLALLEDRYQWNGAFPLAYTLEEGKR